MWRQIVVQNHRLLTNMTISHKTRQAVKSIKFQLAMRFGAVVKCPRSMKAWRLTYNNRQLNNNDTNILLDHLWITSKKYQSNKLVSFPLNLVLIGRLLNVICIFSWVSDWRLDLANILNLVHDTFQPLQSLLVLVLLRSVYLCLLISCLFREEHF